MADCIQLIKMISQELIKCFFLLIFLAQTCKVIEQVCLTFFRIYSLQCLCLFHHLKVLFLPYTNVPFKVLIFQFVFILE